MSGNSNMLLQNKHLLEESKKENIGIFWNKESLCMEYSYGEDNIVKRCLNDNYEMRGIYHLGKKTENYILDATKGDEYKESLIESFVYFLKDILSEKDIKKIDKICNGVNYIDTDITEELINEKIEKVCYIKLCFWNKKEEPEGWTLIKLYSECEEEKVLINKIERFFCMLTIKPTYKYPILLNKR